MSKAQLRDGDMRRGESRFALQGVGLVTFKSVDRQKCSYPLISGPVMKSQRQGSFKDDAGESRVAPQSPSPVAFKHTHKCLLNSSFSHWCECEGGCTSESLFG